MENAGIAVAAIMVLVFYTYTVRSAGGFERDRGLTYYHSLVDGFMAGQLSLKQVPDPRLMALADPYDPALNRDFRLPDASYYRGKYYIYFGPLPALGLLLPYRLLTGVHLPQGVAVLIYCLAGLVAASGIWLKLRTRHFPGSSWWMAPLGILLLGFGTHLLALARRPEIWELPIAAGFACTMMALFWVCTALGGRSSWPTLGLASLCLGLAMMARPTALLATVILAVPLWRLWRSKGDWPRGVLAAAIPFGAIMLGLLAYNQARFGSPLEFGQRYQLTSLGEVDRSHFGLDFARHNLRLYFFWPVSFTADWPFVAARPLPEGPAGYYGGEELYCLAGLFPFLWLAFCTGGLVRPRPADPAGTLRANAAAMAGAFFVVGGLILSFFSAAERYMVEFVPVLMLLALVGALVFEEALLGGVRIWGARLGLILMALVTISSGILISFDYHQRSMRRTDPAGWRQLERMVGQTARTLHLAEPPAYGYRLQIEFGASRAGEVETLAATSDPKAPARIVVEYGAGRKVRLGVEASDATRRWGDWFETDSDGTVECGIHLPELAPSGPAAGGSTAEDWQSRAATLITARGRTVLAIRGMPSRNPGQTLVAAATFSGRLSGLRLKPFWPEQEFPDVQTSWFLTGPAPRNPGERIPLLAGIRNPGGEILLLEGVRPGAARLVVANSDGRETSSAEFAVNPDVPTLVEIEHEAVWPWSRTEELARPMPVRVNGMLVWRIALFPGRLDPDKIQVASNPDGWGRAPKKPVGWRILTEAPARKGEEALCLRVMLPQIPAGSAEPLVVLGEVGQADIVGLRHVGNNRWVCFLDRWGIPLQEGEPMSLDPGVEHEIAISLPLFRSSAGGKQAGNQVAVDVDGRAALRALSDLAGFSFKDLRVGRNELGATTCSPEFTGWLMAPRWQAALGSLEPQVP